MSLPFTVTHPIGRVPLFPELQAKAEKNEVKVKGNDQVGEFSQRWVKGHYKFVKNGEIDGDFTGQVVGTFYIKIGKAEVTIAEKPIWLLEAVLKPQILAGLKKFCDEFPPAV